MVAGFDRYFQIAPCFRDEDARADRSPGEFYQLDIEMSFVTQDDLFAVIEEVMEELSASSPAAATITAPLPAHPLRGVDAEVRQRQARPAHPAGTRRRHRPLRAAPASRPSPARRPRAGGAGHRGPPAQFFDQIGATRSRHGAKGLAWLVVREDGTFKGPIAKFLTEDRRRPAVAAVGAEAGHAIFFGAADVRRVSKVMGGWGPPRKRAGMFEEDVYRFCWIIDFPMYEKDEATGAIAFSHNPFSMPQGGMEALNTMDPLDIKAYQYDIVCNGYELSSARSGTTAPRSCTGPSRSPATAAQRSSASSAG